MESVVPRVTELLASNVIDHQTDRIELYDYSLSCLFFNFIMGETLIGLLERPMLDYLVFKSEDSVNL